MHITIAYYPPNADVRAHLVADDMADAIATVRAMKVPGNNLGSAPVINVADQSGGFRASLGVDRATGRPRWSLSFVADGIYKNLWCRCAENCGVRYASHRTGYVASERAMGKFVAAIGSTLAARAARDLAVAA